MVTYRDLIPITSIFKLFRLASKFYDCISEIMTSTVEMRDDSRGRPISKAKVSSFMEFIIYPLFSIAFCISRICVEIFMFAF